MSDGTIWDPMLIAIEKGVVGARVKDDDSRWHHVLTFEVHGHPATAGSKTSGVARDGRPYTRPASKRTRPWMDTVANVALTCRNHEVLLGPIRLILTFRLARPKGHYRTGKNAHLLRDSAPPFPTTVPDLTKMTRAVEDALKGIIWRDDAQVVQQDTQKVYALEGEGEGVKISIWTYE